MVYAMIGFRKSLHASVVNGKRDDDLMEEKEGKQGQSDTQ